MSNQLPVAVINGIEKFGAKKLAEWLRLNDIKVIGLGEFSGTLEEISENVDYWFDFDENQEIWKKANDDKSRLTIVGVNRSIETGSFLAELSVNWRIINVHGVYGEEMEDGGEGSEEVSYLIKAIRLAISNKNLILPPQRAPLRLMAVNDFREVVLRASFLSGTEKKVFDIWGREIGSEEIAKVLIEEGKMTRFKVEEEEIKIKMPNNEEVLDNWQKLRWQPTVELSEGMKETMQYFFSKTDEDNRKKKLNPIPVKKETPGPADTPFEKGGLRQVAENKKRYEVMVEQEENERTEESEKPMAQMETEVVEPEPEKKPEPESEMEVVEESFEEIKPILVKNSNMRPVAEKEEQIPPTPLFDKRGESRKTEEVKRKKMKFGLGKYGKWIMAGLLTTVVFWGIWGLWRNYQMWTGVKRIESLILTGKYVEATSLIKGNLSLAKKEDDQIEYWGLNKWVWGRRYQGVLKVMEEGLVLGNRAVDLSQKAEDINGAIFNDKTIDWKGELAETKVDLNEVSDGLGVLLARLAGDWSWVPDRWKGELAAMKQQLSEISEEVSLGKRAVDLLPDILGTDGSKKDFMVLLQNESELRAGGGFIGSWAVLSFEGGKLTNFDIKDIYEADGQLKGHVEPPVPIKNYLGEASWYMRDANWQADFPTAAKDIQWFLDKETGRKVDGVIGVNIATARAILGVTGEIYVPDFKEKINKDNIYEQAEFYSETNSFAGSTQKASFLGALGKQLFETIKTLSPDKRVELVKALMDLFNQNEIQMALNDKTAAGIVADLGWDGAIYDGKCSKKDCFADYLYVVESNFGVNKANYFLTRNINEVVDISPGAIGRVLKINYENTAKNTTWPGGDYKDYLRIYVPVTSNLAEVSITDNNGVKTVISGTDLSVSQVGGKKEIGFLATVPVGQKRTVSVSYSDQIDLSKSSSFSYLEYMQKQSGFGTTPVVTLVSIPDGWQTTGVEPTASMVNGKLLFSQKMSSDIKMGVEIGK